MVGFFGSVLCYETSGRLCLTVKMGTQRWIMTLFVFVKWTDSENDPEFTVNPSWLCLAG